MLLLEEASKTRALQQLLIFLKFLAGGWVCKVCSSYCEAMSAVALLLLSDDL